MYYIIPVKEQELECVIGIYENGKKMEELQASIGQPADFFAWIDISMYQEGRLELKLEKGECDLSCIRKAKEKPERRGGHPFFHYTPDAGWLNDPNGLIYDDETGEYHFCFQHNPYGTKWGNMTWTHVKTRDFLSYSEETKIFRPSDEGPVFSGTALKVENNFYYFYTIGAGNSFWSVEHLKGNIQKMARFDRKTGTITGTWELEVDAGSPETRDPKVFYKNGFFYLILYCMENEFRVYSSENLTQWREIQRITEPGMWECPDIFFLKDKQGEEFCVFWSADGFYLVGRWTAEGFVKTEGRKTAYQCNMEQITRYYAAQTFANNKSVVQMAWIQSEHRTGKCYTGELSLPVQLILDTKEQEHFLRFYPLRELEKLRKKQTGFDLQAQKLDFNKINNVCSSLEQGYELEIQNDDRTGQLEFDIGNTNLYIDFTGQKLKCGEKEFQFPVLENQIRIYADNDIIEIFSGNGSVYCTEKTENSSVKLKSNTCGRGSIFVYELKKLSLNI